MTPSRHDTLRVGIDGRVFDRRITGIQRYAIELCRALDEAIPRARFYVYALRPVQLPMQSTRWIQRNEESSVVRRLFLQRGMPVPWFRYRLGRLCQQDDLDVFWGTLSLLPRLHNSVKGLVTVYDLNPVIVPKTIEWRNALWLRLFFKRSVERADAIVTISHGTASRLQDLFGLTTDAIVSPAVSRDFQPRSQEEVTACLCKYGLKAPYLMALGTWEPRKNIDTLVRTFVEMKKEGILTDYSLAIVGGRGWRDKSLAALITGAAKYDVLPLGYVPDMDLPALYSGCETFVFPSIYEGFGIPIVEALACGARVVASDIKEIREAGGNCAIYVPPNSEGLRSGILEALGQPKPQNTGTPNARSWKDGANQMARLFFNLRDAKLGRPQSEGRLSSQQRRVV